MDDICNKITKYGKVKGGRGGGVRKRGTPAANTRFKWLKYKPQQPLQWTKVQRYLQIRKYSMHAEITENSGLFGKTGGHKSTC